MTRDRILIKNTKETNKTNNRRLRGDGDDNVVLIMDDTYTYLLRTKDDDQPDQPDHHRG